MGEFESWLLTYLDSVGLGDEEFVDYIRTILDEDTLSADEKEESISSFLEAAAEVPEDFTETILKKWDESLKTQSRPEEKKADDALASTFQALALSETYAAPVATKKNFADTLSAEDRAIRQAIARQYGNVEESDEDDDSDSQSVGVNANKQAVTDQAAEARSISKKAHEEKKVKDKLDLQKDKDSKAEKKEKRKAATVKQERRR